MDYYLDNSNCRVCGVVRSACRCAQRILYEQQRESVVFTRRVGEDIAPRAYHVRAVHPSGILVRGIASTVGWGQRDMRKVSATMPVPLLWGHDVRERIGAIHRLWPDGDALYFEATIPQPDHAGREYRKDVLEHAWVEIERAVRDDTYIGVSGAGDNTAEWELTEASLCPTGANPCCVLTNVRMPNGTEKEWPAPAIVRTAVRQAWYKHTHFSAK